MEDRALDSIWILVSAFLVFFMHAGFALVESGFCRRKNAEFNARYPDAALRLGRVVARIRAHAPRLPDGDPLTVRRLRQLGHGFGFKEGYGRVYHLLEEAEESGREGPLPSPSSGPPFPERAPGQGAG